MSSRTGIRMGVAVFFVALVTRFVGVVVTTFTNLNTYAQADVYGYAAAAEFTAAGLRQGRFVFHPELSSTYHSWAPFIAPFWLLPGPSRVYARIGVAMMGAYAVYNVYVITRELSSKKAALVAVIPLTFYPSFILIHSSVLREVGILLGITTAARLLIVPPRQLPSFVTHLFAGGFLWLAVHLRPDNLPIFLLLLALATIAKYRNTIRHPTVRFLLPPALLFILLSSYSIVQSTIERLGDLRRRRAEGRTEFLGEVMPDTVLSTVAFSWIAAAGFLFAPAPWQVSQFTDFVAMFEGIGNLLFFIAGIYGARVLAKQNLPVAVVFTVGILLASVLYGIATPNIGTAIRFRQMLLWALFILGGIAIGNTIQFSLGTQDRSDITTRTATAADD